VVLPPACSLGTEPTAAAFVLPNLARGVINDLDGIAS